MAQEVSLAEIIAIPRKPFRGEPWYNGDGDCVMWFFSEQESYATRIDDKLTVYRAIDGNEVVGCQVKGVRALLAKLGTFDVRYQDNGVSLALLFCISHWNSAELTEHPYSQKPIYNSLYERANARRLTVNVPSDEDACYA